MRPNTEIAQFFREDRLVCEPEAFSGRLNRCHLWKHQLHLLYTYPSFVRHQSVPRLNLAQAYLVLAIELAQSCDGNLLGAKLLREKEAALPE